MKQRELQQDNNNPSSRDIQMTYRKIIKYLFCLVNCETEIHICAIY